MSDPPQKPRQRSWIRRTRRAGVAKIRSVAARLNNRLQVRLSSVIGQSSVASSVRAAQAQLSQTSHQISALAQRLEQHNALVSQQANAPASNVQDAVADRFQALQIGIDATRLESRAIAQSLKAIAGALSTSTESLQRSVDRLKSDVEPLTKGHESERITSQSITDLVSQMGAAAELLGHLHRGMDALRIEVGDRGDTAQAVSSQLMAKSEHLLQQRSALSLANEVLVRTSYGYILVPAEDTRFVAHMIEGGGQNEPGTMDVLSAILREGDRVLDVGAHVGTTVLPAARLVGTSGHIIACEPGSRVRGLLKRNLALNGLDDRVVVHPCAAGDKAGKLLLNIGQVLGHSSLLSLAESKDAELVDVSPLDDLIEPGQRIHLAKLDAEGFELQVWQGMRRILNDNPEIIVIVEFGPVHLERAGVSIARWLQELRSFGHTVYEIDEEQRSVRPVRSEAELASVFSLNMLLMKQPLTDFPKLRLKTA